MGVLIAWLLDAPRAAPQSLSQATGLLLLPHGQAWFPLSPVTPRVGGQGRLRTPIPGWTVPGAPRICWEGKWWSTVPSDSPGGHWRVASGGTARMVQCGLELPCGSSTHIPRLQAPHFPHLGGPPTLEGQGGESTAS